jgi:hypothetical protein
MLSYLRLGRRSLVFASQDLDSIDKSTSRRCFKPLEPQLAQGAHRANERIQTSVKPRLVGCLEDFS